MDFYDELKALGERSRQKGPSLLTEEATKTALVMPFIKALGYDVFNIDEVVPEFVATGSDRKDQRVDYAIMKDGKPVIYPYRVQGIRHRSLRGGPVRSASPVFQLC